MDPLPRVALEGKGPQRRPQKRFGRRLEEVAKTVGGGYCRLQMPLKLAVAVRETVAGHRLGALEGGGGGYLPPFQCISAPALLAIRGLFPIPWGLHRPVKGPWMAPTSYSTPSDRSCGHCSSFAIPRGYPEIRASTARGPGCSEAAGNGKGGNETGMIGASWRKCGGSFKGNWWEDDHSSNSETKGLFSRAHCQPVRDIVHIETVSAPSLQCTEPKVPLVDFDPVVCGALCLSALQARCTPTSCSPQSDRGRPHAVVSCVIHSRLLVAVNAEMMFSG